MKNRYLAINRLNQLRIEKGYTLEDIERKTGIKRSTYNNYENGNTEPKLATWEKLADFFQVSLPFIQGYDSEVQQKNELTEKQKNCPYCHVDSTGYVKPIFQNKFYLDYDTDGSEPKSHVSRTYIKNNKIISETYFDGETKTEVRNIACCPICKREL